MSKPERTSVTLTQSVCLHGLPKKDLLKLSSYWTLSLRSLDLVVGSASTKAIAGPVERQIYPVRFSQAGKTGCATEAQGRPCAFAELGVC
jgi:hypothetical protein